MRMLVLLAAALFCSISVSADDRTITFDKAQDFSALKTFTVHDVKLDSLRPEIKNALLAAQVTDVVRTALTNKGLTATTERSDVVVDSRVTTRRGGPGVASGFEGTLVIDVTTTASGKLVWHGVYQRVEDNATKLSKKLPDDAKKLLSDYPPKKK